MKTKIIALFSLLLTITASAQFVGTKAKKIIYKKAESGIFYKFFEQDKNLSKPKTGDKIRVSLSYLNSKDSLLFDSSDPKVNQGKKFIEFELGAPSFKGSFEDALMMMSIGDSASFQLSADSVFTKTFFMKELPKYIEKGSLLTFNVKLMEILTSGNFETMRTLNEDIAKLNMIIAQLKEKNSIYDYLKANNIKEKPTDAGLYYIPVLKGKTAKPQKGDTVKVNYVGRLLNGKVFDTNIEAVAKKDSIYNEKGVYKPLDLPFNLGNVIPGWDQGIELMTVGSKAKFIIPSSLAYGDKGLGEVIPPFSALMFEVELISIKSPLEKKDEKKK